MSRFTEEEAQMIDQRIIFDKGITEILNEEKMKKSPDPKVIKDLDSNRLNNLKALWKLFPAYTGLGKVIEQNPSPPTGTGSKK